MKKRLAMIVTMLMVTVSMAACGGKKDTTADKESVINTEATEAVAETEEPATEEVEAATETEEPETEAVAEQETTGKLESNTSGAENTAAQPSDNNTSKSNKSNSNSGNKASAGSTATAGTTTSNAGGTTGSSNNTNTSDNSAAPAHVHTWVLHEGSGHYETQVVKEAWDEPIYSEVCLCNDCGADITSDPWDILILIIVTLIAKQVGILDGVRPEHNTMMQKLSRFMYRMWHLMHSAVGVEKLDR